MAVFRPVDCGVMLLVSCFVFMKTTQLCMMRGSARTTWLLVLSTVAKCVDMHLVAKITELMDLVHAYI